MADVKVPFNLKLLAVALVALVLIGVAGFHFIEGWTYFDGFYMVLTTITSIGYGEIHPLSHTGRLFNSFIIITGVGLVLLLVGGASRTLLEFELQSVFGRRRMDREISRLTGHFIICGAGRVGRSAARELARRPLPFVVVDTNEEKLKKYSSEGWLTFLGDATLAPVLQEVRIEQAKGLVAATTTDAINIYIILTARSLNPKLKIIARASEEDAEKHLITAGADSIVSPYRFAGYRIAQA
ncbi:MAG TPA: potassium channel family protein, partial [Candidatus Methylomirabilis sp.]|nr:potassium channel family protein [Candidatus Methylomirabilis sp.]